MHKSSPPFLKWVESFYFNIKWILPLFYFGLVAVLFLYGYSFIKEIIQTFLRADTLSTDDLKVTLLDFIDIVMLSNLAKMIITGSWNSFISKDHGYKNENVSSGMLKIKISTSIIVLASIHLLKSFISEKIDWNLSYKQLDIYAAFLVSALVLGVLEYLHVRAEIMEQRLHHDLNKTSEH